MKANEVFEKIYVHWSKHAKRLCASAAQGKGDIEYIQIDAFIEKACSWLKNNASDYAFVDTDRIGNVADIDLSLVQDFKTYMKGE